LPLGTGELLCARRIEQRRAPRGNETRVMIVCRLSSGRGFSFCSKRPSRLHGWPDRYPVMVRSSNWLPTKGQLWLCRGRL